VLQGSGELLLLLPVASSRCTGLLNQLECARPGCLYFDGINHQCRT
jgi:hypothetical protein